MGGSPRSDVELGSQLRAWRTETVAAWLEYRHRQHSPIRRGSRQTAPRLTRAGGFGMTLVHAPSPIDADDPSQLFLLASDPHNRASRATLLAYD